MLELPPEKASDVSLIAWPLATVLAGMVQV
jgi:hypothetical protein